ncbi:MAG: hypothetical protein AB8G15_12840 [Saprospiraceae bacterium]
MSVLDYARVVIYRINKKGLEIFLVNDQDGHPDNWTIPQGKIDQGSSTIHFIALEPTDQDGQMTSAYAVEGDWHDIPSIRAIVKEDVRIVKDQIKQRIPDLEKGTFFAVKEAVKKVVPHEYAVLKELKDILLDRNQAKYI